MKVLKFGGTSVGSAQRMKEVAKLSRLPVYHTHIQHQALCLLTYL